MEIIKEPLLIEELETLLKGGEIDFLVLGQYKIKITGENFTEDRFESILEILKMTDTEYYLMENILGRYNNEEYWDKDFKNELEMEENKRGKKMNREFKKETLKGQKLPLKLDSFTDTKEAGVEKYIIEYDGWHFTGATMKSATDKVLKYIFVGGIK